MPTYGYRCPKCSTEFEVWQSMRDQPGAACPSCGAAANRMFFPAGIVFKGSGFYKTDSRGASSSAITSESGDSGSKHSGTNSSNGASKSDTSKSDSSKSESSKSDGSTSTSSSEASSTTKKSASTDTAG